MEIIRTLALALGAASMIGMTMPSAVMAEGTQGEIHYGHIESSKGDTALIQYKGPWGEANYTCDVSSLVCDENGTSSPSLYPSLVGRADYPKNSQGTYGVREFVIGTTGFYILYDISGDTQKQAGTIPFAVRGAKIKFSPSGNQVIFTLGSTVARYDIPSKRLSSATISQSDRPFEQISYNGTYLSTYNYGLNAHRVFNLVTGAETTIPSTAPSYVEFSADESHAAYLNEVSGFRTLFVRDVKTGADVKVTENPTTVEDYLWAENALYYMANAEDLMRWHLYSYDPAQNEIALVEKDVSYGDYLKRISSSEGDKLAFLKTEGKNTNVFVVDPNASGTSSAQAIRPVPASPASDLVERTSIKVADRYAALWAPKTEEKTGTLFVWLHGGPMRQAAVDYHSYLSYAVYDELLERLAEGGNYVLKLDYAGSTGYGTAFRDSLNRQVGVADVADVKNAIDEMKQEYDIDKVYLIGNSYGGYLALKGIVDDAESVDGAISINGVSDWYSLISRIPSSPFSDLFGGTLDLTNASNYLNASTYKGLTNLDSDQKILVVHGEQDATVPVWQSTNYLAYAATNQTVKADVEGISFPTEEHILRARSTLDTLCSKITSFFGLEGVSCSIK